jgi:hypothetical protein
MKSEISYLLSPEMLSGRYQDKKPRAARRSLSDPSRSPRWSQKEAKALIREDEDEAFQGVRLLRAHRTVAVKQAILATVVSVENKSSDSVVVKLESDALEDAAEIVSTGLNLEHRKRRRGSRLEVTCNGDPKAEPGDKVAVVVKTSDVA